MSNKKSAKHSIQRVELNTFYWVSIFCPFCGQKVVGFEESEEVHTNPCDHTLFVAHDLGFEYRSHRFNENLGITDVGDDDVLEQFDENIAGYDGITDLVDMPDSVKFAAYVGPPSGEGSYCGFAPFDED